VSFSSKRTTRGKGESAAASGRREKAIATRRVALELPPDNCITLAEK
jgi:hypothetical protein